MKLESGQQDSVAVRPATDGSKVDEASLSERACRLLGALDQAWNRGDVDALDGVLHEDYVRHGRTRDRWTRSEFKKSVLATRAALPDLTMTIEDCVEDGDRIAVHWRSTGTHRGAYLGVLPTGRTITMHGATFSSSSATGSQRNGAPTTAASWSRPSASRLGPRSEAG